MTLWSQFQNLAVSREGPDADPLIGVALVHGSCHYVFKDASERPCAMFRLARHEAAHDQVLSIALQQLVVEPSLRCRVWAEAREVEGDYALLRCLTQDEHLHEYLLKVLEKVLEGRVEPILPSQLNALLLRLVELFEAAEAAPVGTVAGLWAELFVALRSRVPLAVLEAWHPNPEDRYDFASGVERIEVKCSTRRRREHHFSFEQAYPPNEQKVVVASLFVETSRGGPSLGDLWDEARDAARGRPDLVTLIERVCLRTLGRGWGMARETRYDALLAKESLAFFAIEAIPRLSDPLPAGVLRADFLADLTGSPQLGKESDTGRGPLLRAAMDRASPLHLEDSGTDRG